MKNEQEEEKNKEEETRIRIDFEMKVNVMSNSNVKLNNQQRVMLAKIKELETTIQEKDDRLDKCGKELLELKQYREKNQD